MPGPTAATQARHRQPTKRELAVLGLVSEQGAIPVDQLARFLGVKPAEARKIAKELQVIGCVEMKKLVEGDDPWVWLSNRGARLSSTSFSAMEPALSRLAHTRAINEARLLIEQTQGTEWVCERALKAKHSKGAKIPDALVRFKGEEHAIEVELTAKSENRLREIIAEHCARYDAVVYFCSPRILALLERIKEETGNPLLFVRALPGWSSSPPKPKSAALAARPRRGEPRPDDIPILDLISEQGAIPIDQLALFLDFKLDKAKRTVKRLHEAGLVRREKPLAGEPEWIWLSKRGARFSTTGLSAPRPKVGSFALMRAINEVRLGITEANPGVGWVSRRILLSKLGRNAAAPKAVVEIGDEHHAIEVRLSVGPETKVLEQIQQRLYDYDAAVYFCAPRAMAQMERLAEKYRWPNLVVRGLPDGG